MIDPKAWRALADNPNTPEHSLREIIRSACEHIEDYRSFIGTTARLLRRVDADCCTLRAKLGKLHDAVAKAENHPEVAADE